MGLPQLFDGGQGQQPLGLVARGIDEQFHAAQYNPLVGKGKMLKALCNSRPLDVHNSWWMARTRGLLGVRGIKMTDKKKTKKPRSHEQHYKACRGDANMLW